MKQSIEIMINRAEGTWLTSLYSNAARQFSNVFLPSHDHTHHLRVWNLCKSILTELDRLNFQFDQSLLEGVLIAALFHDLGMVRSTREDHGMLGMELCLTWFQENDIAAPDRFEEILDAIERHDVKEKGSYSKIDPYQQPEILTLLSIADDLEAFGTIGIYRYAEIYLMRNITLSQLGDRVLANAESRYQNLQESGNMFESLNEYCHREYTVLKDFYHSYNLQLLNESSPETAFNGHLGVINYIRTLGIEERISPENIPNSVKNKDTSVSTYFRTLKNELEQARN